MKNRFIALFILAATFRVAAQCPEVEITATSTEVCAGGTTTFSIVTPPPGCTFQWQAFVFAVWQDVPGATNSAYTPPAIPASGQVRVVATCGPDVCESDALSVTVYPTPAIALTSYPSPICSGGEVTLSASITNGPTTCDLQWEQNPGAGWSVIAGETADQIVVTPNSTTQYRVSFDCLSPAMCNAVSTPITVTVIPDPSVNITGTLSVCSNQSTTLTATLSPPEAINFGPMYVWSPNGPGGGSSFTTPALTASTTYAVNVSFSPTSGCGNTSASALVSVVAPPTVNDPADITQCAGTPIAVNFVGTGANFTWTNNNPAIGLASAGSGNIAFVAANAASQQTATIQVTPHLGACSGAAQSFTITINPAPATPNITVTESSGTANDGVLCSGGAQITLSSNNAPVGGTCQWSATPGGASNNCSWNQTPNVNTTYTLTVSVNGCSNTATRTVTIQPEPAVDIVVQTVPCLGGTLRLDANPPSFSNYQWLLDGVQVQNGASFMYAKSGVTAVDEGQYRLVVTDNFGCTGDAVETIDNIPPTPAPALIGDASICPNQQEIYYVADPGATSTFTWNLPAVDLQSFEYLTPNRTAVKLHWKNNIFANSSYLAVEEAVGICKQTASLNIVISNTAAPDTMPVLLSPVNNILVTKDSTADCYQWGYYDPGSALAMPELVALAGETYQSYVAGDQYDNDRIYWVKTWNGDCSDANPCATLTISRMRPDEGDGGETLRRLAVWPNPNRGFMRVSALWLPDAAYQVRITDALGRIEYDQRVETPHGGMDHDVALPQAYNGVHYLMLLNEKGIYRVQPFVITER